MLYSLILNHSKKTLPLSIQKYMTKSLGVRRKNKVVEEPIYLWDQNDYGGKETTTCEETNQNLELRGIW